MNWNRPIGLLSTGVVLIGGAAYNALEGNYAGSGFYGPADVERWHRIWFGYWLPFNDFIQYNRIFICLGLALLGLGTFVAGVVDIVRQFIARSKSTKAD